MNSSDQLPKVPLWVFFATDLALLAAAGFIASRSSQPLSTAATLSIVACVIVGAIVALVPLVTHFERQKNEQLDERQRELEALARTVSSSADQLSIAAGSLHEIAEVAQRNLRQAEQLPHKLQEKIAEFQAQLANASETEREELERELETLRSSETERLESVTDKLARAAAELAKLEAATHQHLTAANESLGKLALGTAGAIGKAQAAAEQALTQARIEAARQLGAEAANHQRALQSATNEALRELEAKIGTAGTALVDRLLREMGEKAASLGRPAEPEPDRTAATPVAAAAGPAASTPPKPAHVETGNGSSDPGRKPRKARAEDPGSGTVGAGNETASAPAEIPPEPPPVPAEKFTEVAPVVPSTAHPFPSRAAAPIVTPGSPTPPSPATNASPAAPAPGRRRPARKHVAPEPDMNLDIEVPAPLEPARGERVLSSDGATRVIVTAYIGIGNRLFIRGEGPGLAWDKGVPLQFVSIGKWRWETNEASGPIRFKLFKNDEQECSGLGAISLDPGHQQELTASFS